MNTHKKIYETRGFCILMLFVFSPIGVFLLWKYKFFPKDVSIAISATSLLWFIGFLVKTIEIRPADTDIIVESTSKPSDNKKVAETSDNIETSEPSLKSTDTPTNTPKPTEKPKQEKDITESKENSATPKTINKDLELITQPNHPVLFSSTDSAHEFWGDEKGFWGWKDREDKKIIYPDTYSATYESGKWSSCILEMDNDMNFASCDSDYIFGIHIAFDNFEKPANLTLNKALKIAASYLPHDTLKTFYKFNNSISYKPTKKSKEKDCYYSMSYYPKNEYQQDFVLDNHSYSFPNIHITLCINKRKHVSDIWIELYQSILQGRHSIAFDDNYKEVKWKYNLLK